MDALHKGSLNRFLLCACYPHTGTHFFQKLTESMENVSNFLGHLGGSTPKIPFEISPDYYAYRVGHPIDIFRDQRTMGYLKDRSIYVITSVRHPIRCMGTHLRKDVVNYIHKYSKQNSIVYEGFDEQSEIDGIKKRWFQTINGYKCFLENINRLKNNKSTNLGIIHIDKMGNITNDIERLEYVKNIFEPFQFKWGAQAEEIVSNNKVVNTTKALEHPYDYRKFNDKGQELFLLTYQKIIDNIFKYETDWATPFISLCQSELVTKDLEYGNSVAFTKEEFNNTSKR